MKVLIYTVPIALLMAVSGAVQADNVRLHGALVAEPCVIAPGDESVKLEFGTVIDKYLYANQRTRGQAFAIRLTECDLSLGKTVKVTFSGTENPSLKGLLAIDGGSQASGIAIGMETPAGQKLPLNKNRARLPAGRGQQHADGTGLCAG